MQSQIGPMLAASESVSLYEPSSVESGGFVFLVSSILSGSFVLSFLVVRNSASSSEQRDLMDTSHLELCVPGTLYPCNV